MAVHDVTPFHRDRLERIVSTLERHGLDNRYTMLVVPDFHGNSPLHRDPGFARWLRGLADGGVEMVLHGYTHLDGGTGAAPSDRWRGRFLTAGEGEFLNLDEKEAARRLRDGRRIVEDAVGRAVEGFVAPAWLYGPQAVKALADAGFLVAENHFTIWSPSGGKVLLRSPVISWASRTSARLNSSLLWSRLATLLLGAFPAVRVGIHPHDVDHHRLVAEIDRVLAAFLRKRTPFLLGDLIPRT